MMTWRTYSNLAMFYCFHFNMFRFFSVSISSSISLSLFGTFCCLFCLFFDYVNNSNRIEIIYYFVHTMTRLKNEQRHREKKTPFWIICWHVFFGCNVWFYFGVSNHLKTKRKKVTNQILQKRFFTFSAWH